MKMLVMNTCGGVGVVALAEGGAVVAEEALPGKGTSDALMPAVRRLFAATGWAVRELGVVGVVVGPGSFTGVRVGLAAAKGLCEAGQVKMIAMSRLELVCDGDGVALLHAGRGEFYCGEFRAGVKVREEIVSGAVVRQLRGAVTCEVQVAGVLGDAVRMVEEPGAARLVREVQARVAAGAWSDVALTDANYLRRTDAELMLEAR